MLYSTLTNKSPIFSFLAVGLFILVSLFFHLVSYSGPEFVTFILTLLLHHSMVFLVAASGNFIMTRQKIVGIGDFNVLVLLTITLLALPVTLAQVSMLMGLLLAMLLIHRFGKLYNRPEGAVEEFEVGVISGLALLFDPLFALLIIYAFFALNISKSNRLRDFVAIVLGFAFIFFLKILWKLWLGQSVFPLLELNWSFSIESFQMLSWKEFTVIGLLAFWYLRQALHYFQKADQMSIRLRVFYRTIVMLIPFIILPQFFLPASASPVEFVLLLFPFFLFLHQMQNDKNMKKWRNNLLLLGLLLSALVIRLVF